MGAGREKKGKGREREPVIISFTTLFFPPSAHFWLSSCWCVNELESFSNFSREYFARRKFLIPAAGVSNFMSSETEFANRTVHSSKSCRFCKKIPTCSESKVPRVSVSYVVKKQRVIGVNRHGECSISWCCWIARPQIVVARSSLPCWSAHVRMEQGRSLEDALTWRMWAYYPRRLTRKIQFLLRAFLHWRMQWIQGHIYLVKVNNSKPRLWRWDAVRFARAIRSFHKSGSRDKRVYTEKSTIKLVFGNSFYVLDVKVFLQICLLDGDFQFSWSISTQCSIYRFSCYAVQLVI